MTERKKEEKLLRAIAMPPVELPEESEIDASADLAAAPPLDTAFRDRLRAAVRAEIAKDAASEPEAMPQRAEGRQVRTVTPAPMGTVPSLPRYREPTRRWWRPRAWVTAVSVAAALAMAVLIGKREGLLGPWGVTASVARYELVVDEHSDELGSSSSHPGEGTGQQEVKLPLEDSLSAELQTAETVPQVPEVKVWVEQQGRLISWPVSIELQSRPGYTAVALKSNVPLADLSSAGAKVSAGPATLLVVVGVHGKLPSEPEVAARVGQETQEPRPWRLLPKKVTVVMAGGIR